MSRLSVSMDNVRAARVIRAKQSQQGKQSRHLGKPELSHEIFTKFLLTPVAERDLNSTKICNMRTIPNNH